MRNLAEYPITRQEIVECLEQIKTDLQRLNEEQLACGDMRPLLLDRTIKIITHAPYAAPLLGS